MSSTLPVHWRRMVQSRHSPRRNSTEMAGRWSATVGFQGGLVIPCGQVAGAGLPVDDEVFLGEAGMFAGAGIFADRPDHGDGMLGGGVMDDLRSDVAGVDQMLAGQEFLVGQRRVDGVEGVDVLLGGRGGQHVHDHMGQVVVAGFGLVDLVADPLGLSRAMAETSLGIMRGDDFGPRPGHLLRGRVRRPRRGRSRSPGRRPAASAVLGLFRVPPSQLTGAVEPKLLNPHLPQDFSLRPLAQPFRDVRARESS